MPPSGTPPPEHPSLVIPPSLEGTTLYLVRHGETDYNRRRIMQGRRINSSLNTTGQAQADALTRRFQAVSLDAIYTSSLKRAEQTALRIAQAHPETPFHILESLEEMSWGIWEGQPIEPLISKHFAKMVAAWGEGHFDKKIEEGESILDVQARALAAVETITGAYAGKHVLVVTHGRYLRVLLATLLEAYGLRRMQSLHHANTAVNVLVCRNGAFEAKLLNCTAHLDHVETIMVE